MLTSTKCQGRTFFADDQLVTEWLKSHELKTSSRELAVVAEQTRVNPTRTPAKGSQFVCHRRRAENTSMSVSPERRNCQKLRPR
jgi:hypothetical protein